MASFARLTVKPNVDYYEAISFCNEQGWDWLDKRHEGEDFVEYVFRTGETNIRVMLDHSIDKYFFVVRGPEREAIVEKIRAVNANRFYPLKVNTREEAIELASRLEDPGDIYFAALSSDDDFDEGIFECYRHAFEHPDSDVRFYACTSVGYFVGWEEHFTPLLSRLAENDGDPEIRAIAAKTLQVAVKHDWNRIPSPATP